MNSHPLLIEELEVTRLPGMPRGIDKSAFRELVPHINIVAGPNASGKSSTARVIRDMLWAREKEGVKARMKIHIDQDSWVIHHDGGYRQVDSVQGMQELPPLPSAEMADMYILAMHKLISAEDTHIVRDIMRQMAGGFDPVWSARELGYEDAVKRTTITEYKRFKKAAQDVREIKRRQENLKREEAQLAALYKQLENAQESLFLQEMYEKLLQYLEARIDLEQKQRQVTGFPENQEQYTGSEKQQVDELDEDVVIGEKQKAGFIIEKQRHQETLNRVNLPGDGVPREALYELKERQELVASCEQKLETNREDMAAAKEAIGRSVKAIDPKLDAVDWGGIDLNDVNDLDQYIRESHQLASEKRFLETEVKHLEEALAEYPDADAARLQEGIRSLTKWLHETQSSYGLARQWYYLLAAAGLVSVLSAIPFGWYALAGIVIMAVVLVLGLKDAKKGNPQVRKSDYAQTGLPAPAHWTIADVTDCMDDLVRQLQTAHQQQLMEQRLQQRKDDLKAISPRVSEMEEKHEQLKERVGVVPEVPAENLKTQSALVYFLEAVSGWQENRTKLAGLQARRKALEEQIQEEVKTINTLLEKYHEQRVYDSQSAAAAIRELAEQEDARQKATSGIQHADDKIRLEEEKIASSLHRRARIYAGLHLEDNDKQRLEQLERNWDAYREAKRELDRAENMAKVLLANLQQYASFLENEQQLISLPVEEAKRKAAQHTEEGKRAEQLRKEISEIEGQVKITMQGSVLEDALLAMEESLDPLEEIYHQNLASITGGIVSRHISRESEKKDRPAVVKHADRLFSKITQGRYTLKLNTREQLAFLAFDNVQQQNQGLDQLSTGTRIQLLLAVRLAYLESQEQTVKPPIVADELFANSDDVRSKAIMEALAEISKAGRQVFYLTAQGDELAKWEQFLNAHPEISGKNIILTGKTADGTDLMVRASEDWSLHLLADQVPEPENMSHDEYGKAIDVPVFNLMQDDVSRLHIWYLTTDTAFIYHCLKKHIVYWGQLDQFLREQGKVASAGEEATGQMREKAKLLTHFLDLYRQGRARPIDRSVVADSGAVGDAFMEKVNKKLQELNGDPLALVDALKNREVARFQASKADQLENYLIETGFIPIDNPLSPEELKTSLWAWLSNSTLDAHEAEEFLQFFWRAGKVHRGPESI